MATQFVALRQMGGGGVTARGFHHAIVLSTSWRATQVVLAAFIVRMQDPHNATRSINKAA